jgi:8-oxo-dGTP diphosphatase
VSCFEIDVTLPPPQPLKLVVAVALLDTDNRILVGSRPAGKPFAGYWEFPGGKVEAGETPEMALIRELHEELGILIKPSCLSPFTFVSHAYESFHMLMPVFMCRFWENLPQPREGQDLRWVRPAQFADYKFVPGSIPLLPQIRTYLQG